MRLQQEREPELFVHEGQHSPLREDVATRLGGGCQQGRGRRAAQVGRTLIPIESNSRSLTRPTPGTFRMDRSCMNALMTCGSKSSLNCPFGLFFRKNSSVSREEKRDVAQYLV